jgi:sterol desaturase/sphingolipid hydroxylase (fatty acid hydroxylase superfamily)
MEDIITIGLLASYAILLALDFALPARRYVRPRFWRLKGFAFFIVSIGLFTALPFVWDDYLGAHRLVDATELGTWAGALVGLLALQFCSYWWHRTLHRTPLLFRYFHQLHHSAERVDIFGAMYFSPLDVIGFAFCGSFALVWLVGVTPEAALIANGVATFASLFQHANLKTPRWLGYIVQRPENHALHHARGVHGFNYGDISLWDIAFGTFRNPEAIDAAAGYYDGASSRVVSMLLGRDVTVEPRQLGAPESRAVPQALA